MDQFKTHHYAVKSVIKSDEKPELTSAQQAKIEQYKTYVDTMNKFIDSQPFNEIKKQIAILDSLNARMEGLKEDRDMFADIENAIYGFIDQLVKWQTDGDSITTLEKQWGLPEGALDY